MNKKNISAGLILTVALAFGFASCKKEGCTDSNAENFNSEAKKDDGSCTYKSYTLEPTTVNGVSYTKVSGTIDESITLNASTKYLLSGGVFVSNGATLTIEAGTTIYAADDNTVPFLAIHRGSKINANGTADQPIVFTTVKSNPAAGDWGGIIVNGYAPVNNGVDPEGEGGTGKYGGTNAADNSGVLRYVRVEYAGKQFTADNELNGFSFNGVGNGTTLEYLQAYMVADDGFEFFGGTANLSYALSYGSGDDSFDFTYGWSGTGMNWRAEQSATEGDRGIEGDNNSSNNAAAPFSNPTLKNIELVGRDTSAHTVGMKLREGTKATVDNLVVSNFLKGIEIEHDQTLENVLAGDLTVINATVNGAASDISIKGSKDANGNTINQTLVDDAKASSNVKVDGSGTASTSWLTGSWYRNL
ncbi:MAG: hypothetical protein EP338_11110 [Bacteroidetes bacterium]|nr:MAG: hypothetical protein EP338_11110 [Bacteroidota bacterium]